MLILQLLLLALLPAALPHPLGPGDLSCRQCGAHAFARGAHVHGTVLGGPRVARVAREPALGDGGTVHTLLRKPSAAATSDTAAAAAAPAAAAATVDVAVYSAGERQGLALGRAVQPSLFPGFTQTKVACARCEALLGWHFERTPEGAGAAAAAAAADAAAAPAPEAPPAAPGVLPYVEDEAQVRLQHLSTLPCLQYPSPTGWWTYSFCHGKVVEQFHESTRWSMGKFEPQRRVRAPARLFPPLPLPASLPLALSTPSKLRRAEGAHCARGRERGLLHEPLLRQWPALRRDWQGAGH